MSISRGLYRPVIPDSGDEGQRGVGPEAEERERLRQKYAYRMLIQRGRLRLPLRAATLLIGPDCAYHLYRQLETRRRSDDAGEGVEPPCRTGPVEQES